MLIIEKSIVINAERSRVWRALIDRKEFGNWFLVDMPDGEFRAGETSHGRILYPGYEHLTMDVEIVEVVPESKLSWRWTPGAEGNARATTTVTFTLRDVEGGTELRVVESGFEAIDPALRDQAYRDNDGGWEEQMRNIDRHVTANR